MRVLVCGGRNFTDYKRVCQVLDGLSTVYLIIHGGARGADSLAGRYAEERGIPVECYPARWKEEGKAAGVLRNQRMLAAEPDIVIAFPGGKGTADMVRRAHKAGVFVHGVLA